MSLVRRGPVLRSGVKTKLTRTLLAPSAQVTKSLIEQAGQKANLVPGDLRSQPERKRLVQNHVDTFGALDVLVNNASKQIQCKDFAEIDMDNVVDTYNTNILAYMGVTKEALPHLKRGDCILMTTSVTAYKGSAGMIDYSSTKGAMNTFIRSLALQLAPKGIRVAGVAPGSPAPSSFHWS